MTVDFRSEFLQSVCDFGEKAEWTHAAAVSYLHRFISGTDSHNLKKVWQLYHVDIDECICTAVNISQWLCNSPFSHSSSNPLITSRVTRYTDWAKSSLYRVGNHQLAYYNKPKIKIPNKEVAAFILYYINYIEELYKSASITVPSELGVAKESLTKSYSLISSSRTTISSSLRKRQIHQQIRANCPKSINLDNLTRLDTFFETKISSDKDQQKLISPFFTPENIPWTFESFVHLSIANIALNRGFSIIQDDNDLQISLLHPNGEHSLHISKAPPQTTDLYQECIRGMGDRSTGLEPDLKIQSKKNGRPLGYVLGDAKHNANGDGNGYRAASVKAAFHYLQAYQEDPDLKGPFKFTLFFLQGGRKINGRDREVCENSGSLISNLSEMPVIGLGFANRDFSSNIMDLWFSEICSSLSIPLPN